MIFETTGIYRVNPEDGCLDARSGKVDLVDSRLRDLALPFWVQGIRRHDLAVFGASIDETGVSDEGFLVISSSQNQGQLANPGLIEQFPKLQTPELAKKFATLTDEELAQLGVDSLVQHMRRRYGDMKGFVR